MDNVKSNADDTTMVDDDGDEITGIVDEEEEEEEDDESEIEDDDTDLRGTSDKAQKLFLFSLLGCLYSGVSPTRSAAVSEFIDHLQEFHLYDPPQIRRRAGDMEFTPGDLVRSVVGQLKAELKRMRKTGTCTLHKSLKKRIKARILDKTGNEIQIRGDISAIENYLAMNAVSLNP
ncbi:hypothetical protein BGZ83_003294 [Gryganskiella cystojenkinii]|nr:hypothetical protein BGZ83_003294 [Gryganskiella cystojenkinii]